jgi:hypothetical protein
VTVAGAGFVLNNEMDDFTAKPGTPNQFGLVQGEANAIEPGKRMLSAMTPTIVLGPDGALRMVTGTPGGSTIITTVFQTISNVLDFGMNVVARGPRAPRAPPAPPRQDPVRARGSPTLRPPWHALEALGAHGRALGHLGRRPDDPHRGRADHRVVRPPAGRPGDRVLIDGEDAPRLGPTRVSAHGRARTILPYFRPTGKGSRWGSCASFREPVPGRGPWLMKLAIDGLADPDVTAEPDRHWLRGSIVVAALVGGAFRFGMRQL